MNIHSFTFLLAALFPACGMEGPEGPRPTGDLLGTIDLYDINGIVVSDRSGVTVTAEGTSISSVTGADGRWVLSNLPMGTYTISASKAGYGTMKQMGYQFVGGGQTWLGELPICELPAYTVTGMSATTSSGGVTVSGTVTTDARSTGRVICLFAGPTASVSSDPVTYTASFIWTGGQVTTFSLTFPWNAFAGFASRQIVSLVAYGSNPHVLTYTDMGTNRAWYASLNPTSSNVVSFSVP